MKMNVPFLDLKAHHAPHMEEFNTVIREVIDCGAFAGGPYVTRFEEDFAKFSEAKYAIGLGSGTEALWLVLLALDIGPGDEVITSPSSFMATAEAITYTGAKPVFVDIDEKTYTMNPAGLAAALTERTKAIIPVHLFGQSADMDPIQEFARRHNLYVIADACQAHGATYKGSKSNALGDAACYSFYPGKNLGAFGEAGAVVTNNPTLLEKIRILRDHGQVRKYHHTMVGWNCRMDGIQGAVLKIKLRHLEAGNKSRQNHAAHYDRALAGIEEIITPTQAAYGQSVYHIYALRVRERDEVMRRLGEKGVGTGIHYPVPIHLQEAYKSLGYKKGSFPIAERCANEFVSLPMFPELTPAQVEYVAQSVKEVVAVGATS